MGWRYYLYKILSVVWAEKPNTKLRKEKESLKVVPQTMPCPFFAKSQILYLSNWGLFSFKTTQYYIYYIIRKLSHPKNCCFLIIVCHLHLWEYNTVVGGWIRGDVTCYGSLCLLVGEGRVTEGLTLDSAWAILCLLYLLKTTTGLIGRW